MEERNQPGIYDGHNEVIIGKVVTLTQKDIGLRLWVKDKSTGSYSPLVVPLFCHPLGLYCPNPIKFTVPILLNLRRSDLPLVAKFLHYCLHSFHPSVSLHHPEARLENLSPLISLISFSCNVKLYNFIIFSSISPIFPSLISYPGFLITVLNVSLILKFEKRF